MLSVTYFSSSIDISGSCSSRSSGSSSSSSHSSSVPVELYTFSALTLLLG